MSEPLNKELYNLASLIGRLIYKKNSAYRSGYIQKIYKQMGGKYRENDREKPLKRWYDEEWKDIGKKDYPVYRPTKRISENTPLTVEEIDPKNLQEQIQQKQIIKGNKNLKPFKAKLS